MPRTPKVRWHKGNQLWCSDVGEQFVDAKGRTRRRTVTFPGIGRKEEKAAKLALEKLLIEQTAREQNSRDPSIFTMLELYLEWFQANREHSTYSNTANHLGKFASFQPPGAKETMGDRRSSTVRPEDLEAFLEAHALRAPTYRATLHASVQAAFNWAARRIPERTPPVLLAFNPLRGVPKPKIPRSPERYAERDELAAFLRWAWRRAGPRKGKRGRKAIAARFERQFCLLVRLAAHTGARPGELCIAGKRYQDRGFEWRYWNPEVKQSALGQPVGMIVLPPQVHKTGKKTGRPREIVVPPILTRALERHRAHPWTDPKWVFTHRRGRGWKTQGAVESDKGQPWVSAWLTAKVRKLRKLAIAEGKQRKESGEPTKGLELIRDEGDNRFVLYRLRHTRITDLISNRGGLSNEQAAALTGTSGRMIEQVYGHLTGTRLIDLDEIARRRPT